MDSILRELNNEVRDRSKKTRITPSYGSIGRGTSHKFLANRSEVLKKAPQYQLNKFEGPGLRELPQLIPSNDHVVDSNKNASDIFPRTKGKSQKEFPLRCKLDGSVSLDTSGQLITQFAKKSDNASGTSAQPKVQHDEENFPRRRYQVSRLQSRDARLLLKVRFV
jgi:hypothetical protein